MDKYGGGNGTRGTRGRGTRGKRLPSKLSSTRVAILSKADEIIITINAV